MGSSRSACCLKVLVTGKVGTGTVAMLGLRLGDKVGALHPSATLIFAAIAIEVGLKATLLKPTLHGIVNIDSAAALVAALVPDQHNDTFKRVLFGVLKEVGGVDLPAFKRPGCDQTLWEEIAKVRAHRNDVMHKAGQATMEDAEHSIEIASTVLEGLFPKVIKELNLKTDANLRIVTS